MLEDHADLLAHLVDVGVLVGEITTFDDDLARCHFFQEIQAAQEGGLAGARRPDHGDDLTLVDSGGDALEDLVRTERLVEIGDLDHGLG